MVTFVIMKITIVEKEVTVLNLTEKLLATPLRENAGSRSSNRFDYQQVWAFNRILEMIEQDKEFLLLMELHDDVIVLDTVSEPESIDFYQIKTDNKASRYFTASNITKDASKYPEKMSIAQKMIDNFSKFRDETKSIHLVSNKHFDFGDLKCGTKSTERAVVGLYEISNTQLEVIKKGMCQSCHLANVDCEDVCLKLVYYDVSFLDLVNYEDTVFAKFINYLNSIGIESSISKTKTVYHTILGEIRRINNWESKAHNVEELIKRKSIAKVDFKGWLFMLKENMSDNLWDDIKAYLLHDGFTTFEVNNIGKQWKKYQIDSMNIEDINLQDIRSRIQKSIEGISLENSKEMTNYIFSIIKNLEEVKIYPKEYIYAIIIKELFS